MERRLTWRAVGEELAKIIVFFRETVHCSTSTIERKSVMLTIVSATILRKTVNDRRIVTPDGRDEKRKREQKGKKEEDGE